MISQITPAGVSPARRARSTEASVCPVRSSTPPSLALQREHVARAEPGRAAFEAESIATWIVWARSWAEIPVVTPLAGLDRDGEGGLQRRLVLRRHQVEAECLAALGR